MSDKWDEKNKISIKFVLDETFRGRIGVTSAGPGDAERFCGTLQYVAVTHRKSQVKVPSNYCFIEPEPQSTDGRLSSARLPSI